MKAHIELYDRSQTGYRQWHEHTVTRAPVADENVLTVWRKSGPPISYPLMNVVSWFVDDSLTISEALPNINFGAEAKE
jgi:hypothetical protein